MSGLFDNVVPEQVTLTHSIVIPDKTKKLIITLAVAFFLYSIVRTWLK